MRGKTLAPLLMGALMVLPGVAMPAMAQEPDMERFYAERLEELQALWAQPSSLSQDQAAALLDRAGTGLRLGDAEAMELARYLRDAQATDGTLSETAREWVAMTLIRGMGADTWQQGTWDTYGVALTVAYLAAASTGAPVPELLPHNIRIPAIYLDLKPYAGCTGGWSRGYCYAGLTLDLLGVAALDWHFTTDTLALQLPLAIEVQLHWSCGWGCSFWVVVLLPETLIATDAAYVFAYPVASGEFASRVTDSDILQIVYDRLGGISWQKPREVTSAPVGVPSPLDAQTGGRPGVGDLHAVAPAPTYYGLQVPPGLPGAPALPPPPAPPALPAPPVPLPVDGSSLAGQPHTRVRASFGTAPVDSTGVTTVFAMTQIRAWHLNIAIVRWKDVGTAMVPGAPALPASFYYDAGSYFTGGGPNQLTADYGIGADLGL